MSVIFILLLPLTTLLFLSIKETIFISIFFIFIMGILLYIDSLNNTSNIFATNPMALFNLLYTLIIIYSFGFLYHFAILKTFQELDSSNQQKALLLKEVHHRVKNNLNVISSIIGLQEHTLEGKGKEELLKSKARIESIAIVHEMLYQHEDFENINFEKYMNRLSQLLLSMYVETHTIKIHIKSSIDSLSLNIMVQLGIMINEFFTNSIKYAFPINDGDIYIHLHKDEASYILTYYDNGIGHSSPETLLNRASLGIKLIHLTARQLKGSVKLSSPKGLKYEIRFKA
jgi:two-component sensor histidine kinase